MKKFVLITVFLFSSFFVSAQETYTIERQSIQLKTAVEGQLDLLWTITDRRYRYFIRTEDQQFTELIDTQNAKNEYQEQYKATLRELTNNTLEVSDVVLDLPSLARFIDKYNATTNPNYTSLRSKQKAEFRAGIFGGITNSPFVGNPSNAIAAVYGAEIEMLTGAKKRHSGYLQLRHVAETDAFKYKTTELSLGYRFRALNTSRFYLYGDVKFATLNFTKATITFEDDESNTVSKQIDETAFDVPVIIGLGADLRLSDRIYANLSYNQIFAIFFKNQGNFSTDITLGLKFKLN